MRREPAAERRRRQPAADGRPPRAAAGAPTAPAEARRWRRLRRWRPSIGGAHGLLGLRRAGGDRRAALGIALFAATQHLAPAAQPGEAASTSLGSASAAISIRRPTRWQRAAGWMPTVSSISTTSRGSADYWRGPRSATPQTTASPSSTADYRRSAVTRRAASCDDGAELGRPPRDPPIAIRRGSPADAPMGRPLLSRTLGSSALTLRMPVKRAIPSSEPSPPSCPCRLSDASRSGSSRPAPALHPLGANTCWPTRRLPAAARHFGGQAVPHPGRGRRSVLAQLWTPQARPCRPDLRAGASSGATSSRRRRDIVSCAALEGLATSR